MSVQNVSVKQRLNNYLLGHYETNIKDATSKQIYYALSGISNEMLCEKRCLNLSRENKNNKKTIHYLSIEFLIGKSLKNNLWNLEIEEEIKNYLSENKIDIEDVYGVEKDAGLGNGGLGRLAACYLESLAKCGYTAFGHSINYEYGLFKQKIIDGKQTQYPDEWQKTGRVWLNERDDEIVEVKIGGRVIQHYSDEKGLSYETEDQVVIEAIPFDYIVSAYGTDNTATLRLWKAQAKEGIDLHLFDIGELDSSLRNSTKISQINKILYPNDNNQNGKDLRLIQQYFLVSAVMQSIIKNYFYKSCKLNKSDIENIDNLSEDEKINLLKDLPKLVSIHINDTHPALSIPEIMRILIDDYHFGWNESWDALTKIISYTNHTILCESLEVKHLAAIERFMPRLALIIKEIDRRFRIELSKFYKNNYQIIDKLAVINGNNVYMANLAICASYKVNGVAKIHSDILKTQLFRDYNYMMPNKFLNITNGISHRRWLSQSNPELDKLIVSLIGNDYYSKPEKLKNLEKFEKDKEVISKIAEIKLNNKKRLAKYIKDNFDVTINPKARFDVHIKRIHEYKRQLLNVLKIIYLMESIKNDPTEKVTEQLFIFAGKAASGYAMAKRIIQLINSVSKEISENEIISKKLQVLFLENYNVSMAEVLMPATEVSEQISVAGREASGTGNMKAVINGALMLCTVDGANIEICDHCGHENMFEFGLKANEVEKIIYNGYNAMDYYINSEKIRIVIDKLRNGINGEKYDDIANYLLGISGNRDAYMCLADFDSYIDAHYQMDNIYKNKSKWNSMIIHSIANMGYFSSDRSINEYAKNIWNI